MRLKGKSRFASTVGTLLCLLAMAVTLPFATVQAQDGTATEPAPVLRGFRLDPDRAQPDPPPPTATVPPPNETPSQSKPQPRTSPQPRTKIDEPRPAQTRAAPTPDQSAATSNEDSSPETPATPTVVPTETASSPEAQAAEPSVAPANSDDGHLWWQLAAAAGALGFVIAGIWWLRRQRQPQILAPDRPVIAEKPVTPAPVKAAPATTPVIPAPPIAAPAMRKPDAPAPILLEFLPDRAVVSITNLSVSGTLRLTNRSDQPVEQLRLRATLIGASANQAEIISAFHNRDDGKEKPLADLQPGEKRSFTIDMALPLADMPSYVVGSQRLLVPIVVANLAYGNGRRMAQVELACIIGREANPPQPKLGPLRLDLGPRSFAPLGQRPLAA